MKSSIFWDITPCSPLKFNRRFGGICRLTYSLTLKMELVYSAETSVGFHQTTRRYIPEEKTLRT
jgi:hypothetical protein